jgi:hypothetical protein
LHILPRSPDAWGPAEKSKERGQCEANSWRTSVVFDSSLMATADCSKYASSVDSPSRPAAVPGGCGGRCPVTDRPEGVVGQFLHQHAFCSEDAGKARSVNGMLAAKVAIGQPRCPFRQQRAERPQQHLAIKNGNPCRFRLLHLSSVRRSGPPAGRRRKSPPSNT